MLRKWVCFAKIKRREHAIGMALCACIILFIYALSNGLLALKNLELPSWSIHHSKPRHLLNLTDFAYILNDHVCSRNQNDAIKAILIITSYAGNIETRMLIRESYSIATLDKLGIRRIFLLASLRDGGRSVIQQDELEAESRQFSDIVQGNFHEAYRNLTYKHVMGLTWVTRFCDRANFIIKMDDDIVVDLYQVSDLLDSTDAAADVLMGYVLQGLQPIRDPKSKWFVPPSEYSQETYPPFLSGWLYITTPRAANALVSASDSAPFFWIDDTFVTGMLASAAGLQHSDLRERYATHAELLECCVARPRFACDFFAGPGYLTPGGGGLQARIATLGAACRVRRCPRRKADRGLGSTCVGVPREPDLGRGDANVRPFNLF